MNSHLDFEAKVEYWSAEQGRFKSVEVHPLKPLILSVDRAEGASAATVCLWDFQLKKALLEPISVYTLFAESLSQRSSVASSMLRSNPFHQQTQTQRYPSDVYSRKATVKLVHNTRASDAPVLSAAGAKVKHMMGNVTQFGFGDLSSVLYSNGFSSNSHRDLAAWQHLHCSDSQIFLVCEHVVLLYDYFTRQSLCVAMTDSMSMKTQQHSMSVTTTTAAIVSSNTSSAAQPTSAEQIYFNVCAVGGSDGSIRLWDLSRLRTAVAVTASSIPPPHAHASSATGHPTSGYPTSAAMATLPPLDISFQTLSKSPIVVIKSIPRKRYNLPSSPSRTKCTVCTPIMTLDDNVDSNDDDDR